MFSFDNIHRRLIRSIGSFFPVRKQIVFSPAKNFKQRGYVFFVCFSITFISLIPRRSGYSCRVFDLFHTASVSPGIHRLSSKHPVFSTRYVKQNRCVSVTDIEQRTGEWKKTVRELRSTNSDPIWKIPILFKYWLWEYDTCRYAYVWSRALTEQVDFQYPTTKEYRTDHLIVWLIVYLETLLCVVFRNCGISEVYMNRKKFWNKIYTLTIGSKLWYGRLIGYRNLVYLGWSVLWNTWYSCRTYIQSIDH